MSAPSLTATELGPIGRRRPAALRHGLVAVAMLCAALAFAAAAAGDDTDPSGRADGARLFRRYCAACHGVHGDGNGPWAEKLGYPWPRDFTQGLYKFRSTRKGALPTDADLAQTIRRGVPGTAMPAWGDVFDSRQRATLIAYLKSLSPRFRAEAADAEDTVTIPVRYPLSTKASVARGRAVFLLMKCWKCHGPNGDGDGPDAATLKDARNRPIRPRNFSRDVFKNGSEPRDIYRTLATGFDGTPMAAFFDEPMAMLGPLVLQRAEYQAELKSISPQLSEQDQTAIRWFSSTLPDATRLGWYTDAQQQRIVERWRWDLVHYIRSLSDSRSGWRAFAGL